MKKIKIEITAHSTATHIIKLVGVRVPIIENKNGKITMWAKDLQKVLDDLSDNYNAK